MFSFIIGILIIILLIFLFGIIIILLGDLAAGKSKDQTGKILPGLNCGICGYINCDDYLDAIIDKKEKTNLCTQTSHEALNNQLKKNVNNNKLLKFCAKIFCLGDDTAKKEYNFNGEDICRTLFSFYHGDKKCKTSCLGKGDCMKICPSKAIKKDKKSGRIWIDSALCTGCKICIKICPTGVIKMIPENGGHFIACSSHKGEKFVNSFCGKGCINCSKCDSMINDSGRLVIDNNLAVVKYNSRRNLYDAAVHCPTDVIVPIKNQQQFMIDQKMNKNEK
jgi:Na+-translocating ferredoxin:NAD+ oxidoreductase subunit B